MKDENITRIESNRARSLKGKTDWDYLDSLSDEDAERAALGDPESQPASDKELDGFRRVVDVKCIREKLSLTQEQFALQFHLSLATLKDWEQKRSQPGRAAVAFLKVIDKDPDAVRKALEA